MNDLREKIAEVITSYWWSNQSLMLDAILALFADTIKDAERYRWLRDCNAFRSDRTMYVINKIYDGGEFQGKEVLSREALDAAIDAKKGAE